MYIDGVGVLWTGLVGVNIWGSMIYPVLFILRLWCSD